MTTRGSAVLDAVMADAARVTDERSRLAVLGLLRERTFRCVAFLRLAQAAGQWPAEARPLAKAVRWLYWRSAQRAGVEIPPDAQIGMGFKLTHGWGTVVNPGAVIGRNVTVFHGVTIGQGDHIDRDGRRSSRYPVVEDEVWLGPNCAVLGGIRIGKGSRILAGAVVNFDVPPHSLVAGNPAAVVRHGVAPDVDRRWDPERGLPGGAR